MMRHRYALVVVWAMLLAIAVGGAGLGVRSAEAGAASALYSAHWELYAAPASPGRDAGEGRNRDANLLALLWIKPGAGLHAYANPPGATGLPTKLAVHDAPGAPALTVYYPPGVAQPDVFDAAKNVFVYEEETPLFIPLQAAASGNLVLSGTLSMLICSDTSCFPVKAKVGHEWTAADRETLLDATRQPWWFLYAAANPEAAADLNAVGNLGVAASLGNTPGPDAARSPDQAAPLTGLDDNSAQAVLQRATDSATAAPSAWEWSLRPSYFLPALEVGGLGKALALGFLAGLILNFMPCVLPVIGLKLSTLMAATCLDVSDAEAERIKRRQFREHNIFFACGVLLFFLGLSLLLGFTLGSSDLAWGRLFQSPNTVMGLALLVFALGLSLFGVFDLPVIDLKGGGASPSGECRQSKMQAMGTGVLATLLATPCSGPLLGGVLGWTLLQPPDVISMVFLCIGLGMALPYLLMAAWPGLVRFFPRPGVWTGFLEHCVAFFLMASTVFLVSILPRDRTIPALIALLATAFAAWIWGGWTGLRHDLPRRVATRVLAVAVLAVTLLVMNAPQAGTVAEWEPFEPETFARELGKTPMLVDFTADWCPNCKVLEKVTLTQRNLAPLVERYGVRLVKADLTEENLPASSLLQALGSQSIPVVALFPRGDAGAAPLVLRDLFTIGQLEEAMAQAFGQ
ncbi:MAG: cytochrome c biogenesis protein CcdA [Desulfovibrionaceae bacterium]